MMNGNNFHLRLYVEAITGFSVPVKNKLYRLNTTGIKEKQSEDNINGIYIILGVLLSDLSDFSLFLRDCSMPVGCFCYR